MTLFKNASVHAEPRNLMSAPTTVRWPMLGWAVLAAVVAYILRFNISMTAPAMMRDLGLSEKQFGVVLGAFAWSYGLLQASGGAFGQQVGARRGCRLVVIGGLVTSVPLLLVGTVAQDATLSVLLLSLCFGCV